MSPAVAIPADILAELEALRAAFRADAASLVDALASDWDAAARDPSPDRLTGLVRQAHSLAGTAGSFALPELGARARELEHFLDGAAAGTRALADGTPLLDALRDAARLAA
jgi:HPt (histidine-containing phosphotransfer) domain-containing protein